MAAHRLGVLTSLGPITLSQRQSGRWAVAWLIEWEFGEMLDAIEQQAKLMGFMNATSNYRVTVKLEPERARRVTT